MSVKVGQKNPSRGSPIGITWLAEWWQTVIARDDFFPSLSNTNNGSFFLFAIICQNFLNTLKRDMTWNFARKRIHHLCEYRMKTPSLAIILCHHSARLVMPKGDHRDGFVYPTRTRMIDFLHRHTIFRIHTLVRLILIPSEKGKCIDKKHTGSLVT